MTVSNLPRKSTVIQFAPFPVIEIDEIEVKARSNLTGVLYTLRLKGEAVHEYKDEIRLSDPIRSTAYVRSIYTHSVPINAADMMAWENDNGWESEQVDGGHWIFRAPADSQGGTQQ